MAASRSQVLGFARRFQRVFNTGQRVKFQSSFKNAMLEEEKHAKGTLTNWKRISVLIAIPATLAIAYKAFFLDHEEHPDPDGYVQYSHSHIRNKAFPWGDGDHSLFHNDHTNLGFEKSEHDVEEDAAAVEPREDHFITKLIVKYLIDDPDENRKKKNDHMAIIRQRRDEYLEKKRRQQYPPEPIDLEEIVTATTRANELGVDGY